MENSDPKISFVCAPGLTTFIDPICGWLLDNTPLKLSKTFSGDKEAIIAAIKWADVIWLEWANELSVTITHKAAELLRGKRVIVRCHSYEALNRMFASLNWPVVSEVVFVADHVKSLCESMMPEEIPTIVMPNGLQVEKFLFSEEKKKDSVAYLGHINHKKGPMLLLHAFYHLLCGGINASLHIGGKVQDPRFGYYLQYMSQLLRIEDKVEFCGEITNVSEWFADKEYVICSSPWESQNLSVMEGMLCGCKPLVHEFLGASAIYKPEYCWKSFDDLLGLYKNHKGVDGRMFRNFVEHNYNFDVIIKQIVELLKQQ